MINNDNLQRIFNLENKGNKERILNSVFIKSLNYNVNEKGQPLIEYVFEDIRTYNHKMQNSNHQSLEEDFNKRDHFINDYDCSYTFEPGVSYDLYLKNNYLKYVKKSETTLTESKNSIYDIMLMGGVSFEDAKYIYGKLGDNYQSLLMYSNNPIAPLPKTMSANNIERYKTMKLNTSDYQDSLLQLRNLGISEDKINNYLTKDLGLYFIRCNESKDLSPLDKVVDFLIFRNGKVKDLIYLLMEKWYNTLINTLNYTFLEADKVTKLNRYELLTHSSRIIYCAKSLLSNNERLGHTYMNYEQVVKEIFDIVNIKYDVSKIDNLIKSKCNMYVCDETQKEFSINQSELSRIKFMLTNNYPIYRLNIDENTIYSFLSNATFDFKKSNKNIATEGLSKKYAFALSDFGEFYKIRTFNYEYLNGYMVNACNKIVDLFNVNVENIVSNYSKKKKIVLQDKQREAVVKFNKYKNGFFVLNGMAGTGKTFTVRAIIEVAKIINKNSNVKFVAPTGKATKVLKNSLYANGEGFMANVSTIHKELSPEESFYGNGVMSFKHNEYNKIDADIIVCDESSMIDSELMYHFMKAIDYDKTKVIFLGDTNQLSSIGCGNVLNDLINSKNVKTITLDKIKRQASDSGIVKNSLNAINGKPLESGIFNEDFYFVNTTNEQKSLNMTIKSIQRIQDIKKEDNLDNIQILSPTKKGACGTNNLNFEIKNKFMGHMSTGTSIELKKFNCLGERKVLNLNIGDKVIQTENKYSYLEYEGDVEGKDDFTFNENAFFELSKTTHSELISNGDDGVVVGFLNTINHLKYEGELFKKLKKENKAKNGASKTQLDICADEHLNDRCNKDKFVETKKRENKNYSAKYVLIKFENKVVAYQEAVLKQCIDLAYAITIHKSQGSQWNSVVCVFPSYVNRMLTKNLVYTAITRAEKFCVTIGKEEEISNGLKIDAAKRNTSLADFLGLKKSKKKKKKSSEKRYYGSYHKFN